MTAGIYSITKLELELIKIDEIEVYGTYTNGLNSLQIATRKVVKKLKDQVFEYLDDNYETTRIFGIVILAIFILDLITTFILFYACDNAKNTFLLLFYKIPYNYLLQFQRQSQSFKIILMNVYIYIYIIIRINLYQLRITTKMRLSWRIQIMKK